MRLTCAIRFEILFRVQWIKFIFRYCCVVSIVNGDSSFCVQYNLLITNVCCSAFEMVLSASY